MKEFKKLFQSKFARAILVGIVVFALIIAAYNAFQTKESASVNSNSAPARQPEQETQNQSQAIPETNPFETKTNPFKDIKTNPFR